MAEEVKKEKKITHSEVENPPEQESIEESNSKDIADKTNSSSVASDRFLFLIAIFATWIFVAGGMSYIYKEVKTIPKNKGVNGIDKIYERIAKIEEIQEINKNKPDAAQAMEYNRKTVNRLARLEKIVETLPSEIPKQVKVPDNLVNQNELLTILTRVQKLEDDFSKRDGSSKVEDYINPLLMGIMNLRDHLMKGQPYESDLTLLNAIGSNDEKIKSYLKKLEKVLDDNIYSIDDLKNSFDEVAKKVYKSTVGGDDSVWEKTKSLLSNAITIREISDNMEGNSVEAILARAEIYLKSGNISRVVTELEQLKGNSAKLAKEWLGNAKKYRDIEEIFSKIYSRATDVSADIFKIQTAKSPIPEAKPIEKDEGESEKTSEGVKIDSDINDSED